VQPLDDISSHLFTPKQWALASDHLDDTSRRELVPVLSLASTAFRDAFFVHLARILPREPAPRAIAIALACALYDEERAR
jgi:hypothetical protein